MKLPKLIGISGAAGTGKDTLADHLHYGYAYAKYAMAGPMKRMLAAMLQVPYQRWEDRDWKERPLICGKSPRQLAQTLGTEWGREAVHPDLWIALFRKEWERYKYIPTGVVISDVRFENEAKMIRELGGVVIIVKREAAGKVAKHKSEMGLRKNTADITIYNDKSIEAYVEAALLALKAKASG